MWSARSTLALALVWSAPACGKSAVESLTPSPDAPAQIWFQATGGRNMWGLVVLDSSAGQTRVYCPGGVTPGCDAAPAQVLVHRPTSVTQAFQQTQSRAFLRARARYDTSPGAWDGPVFNLRITRDGTTRVISWSRGGDLDPAVRTFISGFVAGTGVPWQ